MSRAEYIVVRIRYQKKHDAVIYTGGLRGYDKDYEYAIGPFGSIRTAEMFAAFCDKAVGALDLLSKAYKLARGGKLSGKGFALGQNDHENGCDGDGSLGHAR